MIILFFFRKAAMLFIRVKPPPTNRSKKGLLEKVPSKPFQIE